MTFFFRFVPLLLLKREAEFLDDRIGQHFSSHARDFRFRLGAGESAVEREFEILSLAHFLEALVSHLLERTLDGLALRIQNALLQRNIDVGFHGGFLIILQARREARYTTGLDQSCDLRVQVGQRALQDFPVAWVLGSFELLQYMAAGQKQALALTLDGDLRRSQRGLDGAGSGKCLSLLVLDRFALPSSCHPEIITASER